MIVSAIVFLRAVYCAKLFGEVFWCNESLDMRVSSAYSLTAVLIEDYVRTLQKRGLTDSYHLLTDREKEILHLLAEGRSNKEVAVLLDLGLSTVETHRANLMQKLSLHNTAEIVLYAVRKGIIV